MVLRFINVQIPAMSAMEVTFVQKGDSQCLAGWSYVRHKILLDLMIYVAGAFLLMG
jgi:hypothetical protein